MRNLTTFRVTLLSLAVGLASAALLYQHSWRIPVVQDLRDLKLFAALWIIATPFAALLTAAVRIARWRSALISGAICLGVSAPLYGLGSSFDQVRTFSQDKAVLCNIRQLAAAADQYFLENNATVVGYDDIVGPGKYIKALNVVAGEDYRANFPFRIGGILSAEFPSGRIINYANGPTPPDYRNIFEASDPRPSWRTAPRSAPVKENRKTVSSGAKPAFAAAAPVPSNEALAQELGKPVHQVRRGTMCASCHAKNR